MMPPNGRRAGAKMHLAEAAVKRLSRGTCHLALLAAIVAPHVTAPVAAGFLRGVLGGGPRRRVGAAGAARLDQRPRRADRGDLPRAVDADRGRPLSTNAFTNCTAFWLMRRLSGFMKAFVDN